MEIIMPAAGLSTRFPNMRPKYSLTDYSGKMMFEKSLSPFIGKHHVTIGLLQEHEDKHSYYLHRCMLLNPAACLL
jgi:2-C-methyl-D-erythritol 4-phosphate cytidylyltransferase